VAYFFGTPSIRQGTLTRRQRSDFFGLRLQLPHVTTSLTTQSRGNPVKYLVQGHNKRTCRPISTLTLFYAQRQAGKLWIPTFKVFSSDSAKDSNPRLLTTRRTL